MSMYRAGDQTRVQFVVPLEESMETVEQIASHYSDEQIRSLLETVQDIDGYGSDADEPVGVLYHSLGSASFRRIYHERPELVWGAELIAGTTPEYLEDWDQPLKMSMLPAEQLDDIEKLAAEYEQTVPTP